MDDEDSFGPLEDECGMGTASIDSRVGVWDSVRLLEGAGGTGRGNERGIDKVGDSL